MPICNKNGIARILRLNSKKGTNAPPLLSKNTPLGNPEYLRSDGKYSLFNFMIGGSRKKLEKSRGFEKKSEYCV